MRKADKEYIDSLTDREVVKAILNRDARITRLYLYDKCYPLFKACFNRYYTGCENCVEFINEIYVYLLIPDAKTGDCYLSSFSFGCTFTCWLKIVAWNYCRQLYRKRMEFVSLDGSEQDNKYSETSIINDIFTAQSASLDIEEDELNRQDVVKVLHLMPNQNYRKLIDYRYIEEKSNVETASILGLEMRLYYNWHKRAKEQLTEILRKEGLL